jgi:hypothetical protein
LESSPNPVNESAEYAKSELDLFPVPAMQMGIESRTYVAYCSIFSLMGAAPIEFDVN